MRKFLFPLLLSLACAASAEPLQVVSVEFTRLLASEGQRLKGRVTLSAPAPAGGTTLIFEPTFKLDIPITVKVDAGQTSAEFPVKIVDNRIFNRGAVNTTVTVCLSGKEYDFPGPVANDEQD